LRVWQADEETEVAMAKSRVEAGVPDMRTTSANVLARLQSSYSELFSALSKVVMQSVRAIPVRTISFQQDTIGAHVATIMKIMKTGIRDGLNVNGIGAIVKHNDAPTTMNAPGISMFLGCMLTHLRACLFEEKRERRTVNIPLLIVLSGVQGTSSGVADGEDEQATFFDAIKYIFEHALRDFETHSRIPARRGDHGKLIARRRQSRTTAASLPAATSVLKRLMSGPSVTSSPVSSVLSRVKLADLALLFGERDSSETSSLADCEQETFSPERFLRWL
jgi:hypothetical protein